MWLYFRLFLLALRLTRRSRQDLVLENLVLRQQLLVHERPDRRPRLSVADRRFWSTVAQRWSAWRAHVLIVQPPTVVRWHRTAWRRYWARRSRRPPGRPRLPEHTRALIRQMAQENRTWGATQIVGALQALDIAVSRTTVRRYRHEARRRPPSPRWRTFLRLQAPLWCLKTRSRGSDDVLARLAQLFVERGPPTYLRSDNGPEFTATVVRDWLHRVGVTTLCGTKTRS